MQQNSEVDVNVLVNLYHTKLATALNQNVLLEAKLQTLKNDFQKEKIKKDNGSKKERDRMRGGVSIL